MYTNFNVAVVEVSSSASHMIDHLKPFTFWNSCTDIKHNGTL